MKTKIASLILSLLLFAGFQNVTEKYRIKTTTNLKTKTTTDYSYTVDGKISSVKNSKGVSTVYNYAGNKVIKKFSDSLNREYTIDTMFLNNKDLVEKRVHQDYRTKDIYSKFEYAADGRMLTERVFLSGAVNFTYKKEISDGNVKSLTQTDGKNERSILYYSYYTDKLNTIGNENMGMGFMGQSSRNLLKGSTCINEKGDSVIANYNYHFDAKGRVSIKAQYGKNGTLQDSTSYTYY